MTAHDASQLSWFGCAGDQAVVDIYGEHTEIHSNNYDGIYI